MGGRGGEIQIDETCLRGRRKNNQGRLMAGNAHLPARANYGNHVVGPWCFGLVEKFRDGNGLKKRFVKGSNGRLPRNGEALQLVCDEHWFFTYHRDDPFTALVREIARLYPL